MPAWLSSYVGTLSGYVPTEEPNLGFCDRWTGERDGGLGARMGFQRLRADGTVSFA